MPTASLRFALALSIAFLAAGPGTSIAQIPLQGIAASAGYYGWAGNNVDRLGPGVRFQLSVFGVHSADFAAALTATRGSGGLEDTSADFGEWGLGATLRHYFGEPTGFRAFAEGYIGWTQLSVDLSGSSNLEEQGIALGPAVGVDVPVAPRVRIFAAADAFLHHYGELKLSEGGSSGESGNSGWRIGGRAGITWAFGAGR